MVCCLYSFHYCPVRKSISTQLLLRGHRIFATSSLGKVSLKHSRIPLSKQYRLQSTKYSNFNQNIQRQLSIAIPISNNHAIFQNPFSLPFTLIIPKLPLPAYTAQSLLRCVHYFGSAAFAYNGATIAGSAGMHILGCTIVGTVNAVGGGTIRDILMGNTPIFWARQPQFLVIGLVTSFFTFLLWPFLEENDLNWEKDSLPMIISDACGVGSISIVGAQNGLQLGLNPYVCVMLGIISSSFGGLVRDILCEQPPRILYNHCHTYGITALCGSGSYVALKFAGISPILRIPLAFTVSMLSRYFAWDQDWKLNHWEWVERKKMGNHFQHNEVEETKTKTNNSVSNTGNFSGLCLKTAPMRLTFH